MDPQNDLKELVKQNLALSQENYRLLHKMRRAQRWRMLFSVLWWLVVFAVSGAAYYYYLQPYLQQVIQLYQNVQHQGAQAQDLSQQISSFFSNFVSHSTTTPTSTTPH